ncbi:MAG: glycosyltransferase family 39 protein [Oculatellaceae cyanobacterium bins.114]|nr:glycosyltransferase family 39 protein [Oculatellaceae cyanobacterium bins.114]
MSGYSYQEAIQNLYTGQVIEAENILIYQSLSDKRNVLDTIHRLATDDSQHPPLYYVFTRLWTGWFGDSIATIRLLPALISLLALPGMYWLCLELFASSSVGWMAMTLVATSPIYVRYAQEARQYSLWMVIILLASATLLRAIRLKTAWNWSIYLLTLVMGLYCHVLFSLLILAHGLYVAAIERFRLSKTTISYLLVSLVAIIAFTPWLLTMWQHKETVLLSTEWTKQPLLFSELVKYWNINICRLFIAWHFRYDAMLVYLAIPILLLISVATYTVCRHSSKRVWLFILILISTTTLPLLLPDLIWGGRRSTNARYFLPSYIGIDLIVAYFLSHPFTRKFTNAAFSKRWHITAITLITSSVLTCAIAVQSNTWWGWSEFDIEISRIINDSSKPLIISDLPLGLIMPLSHQLHPDTKVVLVSKPELLVIPETADRLFNSVFVYNPSDRLKVVIEQQGFQQEVVYQFKDGSLTLSLYQLQML